MKGVGVHVEVQDVLNACLVAAYRQTARTARRCRSAATRCPRPPRSGRPAARAPREAACRTRRSPGSARSRRQGHARQETAMPGGNSTPGPTAARWPAVPPSCHRAERLHGGMVVQPLRQWSLRRRAYHERHLASAICESRRKAAAQEATCAGHERAPRHHARHVSPPPAATRKGESNSSSLAKPASRSLTTGTPSTGQAMPTLSHRMPLSRTGSCRLVTL